MSDAETNLSVPIVVPEALVESIDQLIERYCRRTGERPGEVRRLVEIAIIQRGIDSLRGELSP